MSATTKPRTKRGAAPKDAAAPTMTYDAPAGGYKVGAIATVTIVRPQGQLSSQATVLGLPLLSAVAPFQLPVTFQATDGRTYTLASDDGTTAKYTTTV